MMNPENTSFAKGRRHCLPAALTVLALLLALMLPPAARAQDPLPPGVCQEQDLDTQKIAVCVPPDWNGILVVYAHGYVPPQAPLALPLEELGLVPGLVESILSMGFAFATTSYSKNGYAIEQAELDLNDLVDFITLSAPEPPAMVFLTGASEGGLITAMMIEKYPDKYDGGLAMCGPLGGMPYEIEYLADFRVVFDYFFPWVFDFGADDVPEDAFLRWDTVYAPAIEEAIVNHPLRTALLFNVTKAARIPLVPQTAVTTAQTILRYSVFGTNDLIDIAGGLLPYDNTDTVYSGTFFNWRLNRLVERIDGDPAYLYEYYQTTGNLEVPLVTLHTLLDGPVPFRHELIYAGLAESSGSSGLLTTIPVLRFGHCNFKAEEVLGAFTLLLLQSGIQQP